jgi:uncharacterized glyoxalase superfamily protein PhnB
MFRGEGDARELPHWRDDLDGVGRDVRRECQLWITVPDEAEADRVFAALADGGLTTMPLAKTFWSPKFGMLVDRFGVAWMVSVAGAQDGADCA